MRLSSLGSRRSWIRGRAGAVVVLATTATVLAGCGSSSKPSSAASTASTPGTTAAGGGAAGPAIPAGPIKIGLTLPLSGPVAEIGILAYNANKTYVSQLNAAGGIDGHQVTLIADNDQGDPAIGEANVTKMISQGVVAILAPGYGEVTPAATAIAMRAKVPVIDWEATDLYSTNVTSYPYFFGTGPLDRQDAGAMALYAKQKGYTKVGTISDSTPIGMDYTSDFGKAAAADGVTITSAQTLALNAVSAATQVEALRQSGAQAVELIGEVGGTAIQTALTQDGWNVPIIANTEIASGGLSGAIAARTVIPCAPGLAPGTTPAPSVAAAAATTAPVEQFAGPIFDSALYVLKDAVVKANSTSGPAIKAAIESLGTVTPFPGYSYHWTASNHAGWAGLDTSCIDEPRSPSGLPVRTS